MTIEAAHTASKLERGIATPKRDKTKLTYHGRDKQQNTIAFNIKAKKRREKAKFDKVNKRKNRGKR